MSPFGPSGAAPATAKSPFGASPSARKPFAEPRGLSPDMQPDALKEEAWWKQITTTQIVSSTDWRHGWPEAAACCSRCLPFLDSTAVPLPASLITSLLAGCARR